MRRIMVIMFAVACVFGAVSATLAQSGTPSATPGAASCASPVATGSPVAGATITAKGTPVSCGAAEPVTIELIDIAFKPSEVTVPVGTTITLKNTGGALHNFSIDALGISEDLAPGKSTTVTLDGPAGDYDFYCDIPGHKEAGMTGTLHLQ